MRCEMKFLGKIIPKRERWDGDTMKGLEYPPYILCLAVDVDKQMQCTEYKSRKWGCEHCDGDICLWRK